MIVESDPFTMAFAKRLYELQKRELRNDVAPAFEALPDKTREVWIEHATATHKEYGLALMDVFGVATVAIDEGKP